MDPEEDGLEELTVPRKFADRADLAAQAHPESDCPELSAVEFRRFLKAANEACPGRIGSGRCRAAITRVLLALAVIGITGLTLFLAAGRKGEAAPQDPEISRLKRDVCEAAMGFTRQRRDSLESVCAAPP